MKIDFDDSSYINIFLSSDRKVMIVLSAKDGKNPKSTIINSAEISIEQFSEINREITSKD